MATNQQQFLISVADVFVYDSNEDLVLRGNTLIDSSITSEVQNQDIYGGFGAITQYSYAYQRELMSSLQDCRWDETYIALNAGTGILNELKDVLTSESITLASDDGTLTETPVGNISVIRASGAIQTITPTGTNFTVIGAGNESVEVVYNTNKTVDNIEIDASKFPSTFKVVMRAKLFRSEKGQTQTGELQITIPQFKPMGNFEISLNMNDPATSSIEGKALATRRDGKSIYADISIIPVEGSTADSVVQIAATPSPIIDLDSATSETQQIQVIGLRGNGLSPITLSVADCTFDTSDAGIATVSVGGLITAIGAGNAVINIEYNGLTDAIPVSVI